MGPRVIADELAWIRDRVAGCAPRSTMAATEDRLRGAPTRWWPDHRPAEPDPARTGEGSRPTTLDVRRSPGTEDGVILRRQNLEAIEPMTTLDRARHPPRRARSQAGEPATSCSRRSWAWCSAWCSSWNGFYAGLGWVAPPFADVVYGMWLVPVILAPLLIRKPGAALFAELTAAGVTACSGVRGARTRCSAFVQGAAAELVFALTGYRLWSLVVLAIAAIASAIGARVHDWTIYYADFAVDIQLLRLAIMAASAIAFAVVGSVAIERSLRKAGVLGDPAA